jgi:hypothetical protein
MQTPPRRLAGFARFAPAAGSTKPVPRPRRRPAVVPVPRPIPGHRRRMVASRSERPLDRRSSDESRRPAQRTCGHPARSGDMCRRSAELMPERQHPAEHGEAGPLAPAGILALARNRTAPRLSMTDQRGADVQSCEKQRHSPAHTTRLAAGQPCVNNRRRRPCGFPDRTILRVNACDGAVAQADPRPGTPRADASDRRPPAGWCPVSG